MYGMEKEIWVALIGLVGALLAAWFKWYLDNRYEGRVVNDEPPRSSTPVSVHRGTVNMAAGTNFSSDGEGLDYGHKFAFGFTMLDQGRTLTFAAESMVRQLISLHLHSESADQIKHPAIATTERTYAPQFRWSIEPGSYVVVVVAHSDDGLMTDFDVSYQYDVD